MLQHLKDQEGDIDYIDIQEMKAKEMPPGTPTSTLSPIPLEWIKS